MAGRPFRFPPYTQAARSVSCSTMGPVRPGIGGIHRTRTGRACRNPVCQRLLHRPAHRAAQFPRPVGRHFVPRQAARRRRGMVQRISLLGGTFLQLGEQTVGDGRQLLGTQRIKQHRLVQAAHQFRPEKGLGLLQGLLPPPLRFTVRRAEPQGCGLTAQAARPQIGSQQNDRVGKVRFASLGIGEAAVLQNLQQQILDIPVGFFDLIEEHHAVGPPAHRFGQLAALVVTPHSPEVPR